MLPQKLDDKPGCKQEASASTAVRCDREGFCFSVSGLDTPILEVINLRDGQIFGTRLRRVLRSACLGGFRSNADPYGLHASIPI
jgi:hypothetical protein